MTSASPLLVPGVGWDSCLMSTLSVCVYMCVCIAAVMSDGETRGGETMEHLGFWERWGQAWGLLVGMSCVHQELAAG